MRAYVVVATKGRAREVAVLLDYLSRQTRRADGVFVVGADATDVAGLSQGDGVHILVTNEAGLTLQRNHGLAAVRNAANGERYAVAFFDDDYRPADDWIEQVLKGFAELPDVVGITGQVLADGVKGPGIDETAAAAFLSGVRAPIPHWANGENVWDTTSVYGCNMAFLDRVFDAYTFDENLPLYAWQEDRDFTTQAAQLGRVIYYPHAKGVHMGTKNGRSGGKRLGYSQVANLIYLARKGTIPWPTALEFVAKNFAANHVKMFFPEPWVNRAGLAQGNWMAIGDLALGRMRPKRILEI